MDNYERLTLANVASLASATIASVVMACSWTYRLTCFVGSADGLSNFSSRSTIGSRYGTSVLQATPSQKLMSAAAACACTLFDVCVSMAAPEVLCGENAPWFWGLERRDEDGEKLLVVLLLNDFLFFLRNKRPSRGIFARSHTYLKISAQLSTESCQ